MKSLNKVKNGKMGISSSEQYTKSEVIDNYESTGNITMVKNSPLQIIDLNGEIFITLGKEVIQKCDSIEQAKWKIETRDIKLMLMAGYIFGKYMDGEIKDDFDKEIEKEAINKLNKQENE